MTDGRADTDAHVLRFPILRTLRSYFERFAVLIAIVEAALIYYAYFVETPRENRALKTIDVQMHCNSRWADLFKERLEIEQMVQNSSTARNQKAVKAEIDQATAEYYRQFWSLQNDQFYYYEEGFLPESLYLDWVQERMSEFSADKSVGGVTFSQGWKSYSSDFTQPPPQFIEFTNFLAENKNRRVDEYFLNQIRVKLHSYAEAFPGSPWQKRFWIF